MTKIKICGLRRPQDVNYVNLARPDWCGFVVEVPTSRRSVTAGQLRALRGLLHPAVTPVGVFADAPVELVAGLLEEGVIAAAQLHGGEDEAYLAALRARAPGKPLWQAFQLRGAADCRRASASSADLVLLDGGQGAGKTFDWTLAAQVTRPFLLAGGLGVDNLAQAIAALRPYGVDLSSGVETEGVKDQDKILAAVAAARKE